MENQTLKSPSSVKSPLRGGTKLKRPSLRSLKFLWKWTKSSKPIREKAWDQEGTWISVRNLNYRELYSPTWTRRRTFSFWKLQWPQPPTRVPIILLIRTSPTFWKTLAPKIKTRNWRGKREPLRRSCLCMNTLYTMQMRRIFPVGVGGTVCISVGIICQHKKMFTLVINCRNSSLIRNWTSKSMPLYTLQWRGTSSTITILFLRSNQRKTPHFSTPLKKASVFSISWDIITWTKPIWIIWTLPSSVDSRIEVLSHSMESRA